MLLCVLLLVSVVHCTPDGQVYEGTWALNVAAPKCATDGTVTAMTVVAFEENAFEETLHYNCYRCTYGCNCVIRPPSNLDLYVEYGLQLEIEGCGSLKRRCIHLDDMPRTTNLTTMLHLTVADNLLADTTELGGAYVPEYGIVRKFRRINRISECYTSDEETSDMYSTKQLRRL